MAAVAKPGQALPLGLTGIWNRINLYVVSFIKDLLGFGSSAAINYVFTCQLLLCVAEVM